MKRRFVECAVLLGVMMSVVFLAQTQEGVSHVLNLPPHPDTGIVAPDPNHTDRDHLPCNVDDDWDPNVDADPRDFSDCGVGPNNSKGYKTSWAYTTTAVNWAEMRACIRLIQKTKTIKAHGSVK